MRIYTLYVVALIILFNSCTGIGGGVKLYPVQSGDKWGYVDASGKIIINAQFDEAYMFSGDFALVRASDGKYGFISPDGKFVINPTYKSALQFSEGLAAVVVENGKIQYIDEIGNIKITLDNVDQAGSFVDGMALVRIGDKYGYINKSGTIIVNAEYDEARPFSEGLAAVAKRIASESDKDKSTSKDDLMWGYIDKNGGVAVNFQFKEDKLGLSHPGDYREGMALASSDGKKWGFINEEGLYDVNPQFDRVYWGGAFSNGHALVRQGDVYGYVNKEGKFQINPQFERGRHFSGNNMAAVMNSDGKWGFIDQDGKYLINPQFDNIKWGFIGDIAFVEMNGKYGIIGEDGRYIGNPQFDDVNPRRSPEGEFVSNDFLDVSKVVDILFGKSEVGLGTFADTTTLAGLLDEYDEVSEDDLQMYGFVLNDPEFEAGHLVDLTSMYFYFEEGAYSWETKYKTVQKWDWYRDRYYYDQEYDGIEKRYKKSSRLSHVFYVIDIYSKGASKPKLLSEGIFQEAVNSNNMKKMEIDMENDDDRGVYLAKTETKLFCVGYKTQGDFGYPQVSVVQIVRSYNDLTLDEIAELIVDEYKKIDDGNQD